MNSFRKPFIFIISLFMLIVQVTLAQDSDEIDISGLDGLGDPNQPQCVVPIPFLDGQVWRASGTNGGLSLMDPDPGNTINPVFYGMDQFTDLVSPANTEPVAILIVDSFGSQDNLSQFVSALESGQYPTNSPSVLDQSYDQLANDFENGIPAHGQLVLNHIFGLLRGAGYLPDGSGFEWTQANSTIYVQKVDINYETGVEVLAGDVARGIIQAISTLKGSHEITQFVVNESFAVIPCIVATHQASVDFDDLSFEEYLARVKDQSSGQFGYAEVTGTRGADMVAAVLRRFDLVDSGEYCGGSLLSDVRVQFVASSGNSGLDFPFAPAAWPEVIGVTDSTGIVRPVDPNNPNTYANLVKNGDIANVPGGWYQLVIHNPVSGLDAGYPFYYRGTSFSAPTYTVQAAINMSAGIVQNAILPCTCQPANSQ